jgi:hypothetical protein
VLSCSSCVRSEDEDLLTRQMHVVLLSGDTLNMLAVVTDIAETSTVCFILREIAIVLLLDKRFAALILHIVE